MSLGRTKKPCAGCGKLPSQNRYGEHWTVEKPLCCDCREAIKNYDKVKAIAEKRLKGKLKAVVVPDTHTDRIWSVYDRGDQFNRKPFQEAFLKLCHTLGQPWPKCPDTVMLKGQPTDYHPENFLAFERETLAALQELFSAVQDVLEYAYAEGRERGASMLQDLIEGSMTAQEINEICSRENKG